MGIATKRESPVARTRTEVKRHGKQKRTYFGLIDSAWDSVGNHMGMSEDQKVLGTGFSGREPSLEKSHTPP